jgi:hypothetical protein
MKNIEAAKRLFESYNGPSSVSFKIGLEARDILLSGRSETDLTESETALLLKAYNWAGDHEVAFDLAIRSFQRWGDGFFDAIWFAHHNAFYGQDEYRFLDEADRLICEEIGKSAFWRLRKVDFLISKATGEKYRQDEWQPGEPLADIGALRLAAHELSIAIDEGAWSDPVLIEEWNDRFACVISMPEFVNLRHVAL